MVLDGTEAAVTQRSKLNPKSISWAQSGILMLPVRRVLEILFKAFHGPSQRNFNVTGEKSLGNSV